jgi:cell shape-determining protein MreC
MEWFDVSFGNLITLTGVFFVFLKLRTEHRAEQMKRHEENLHALEHIRIELTRLKHLDDCMDEVKAELKELRKAIQGR